MVKTQLRVLTLFTGLLLVVLSAACGSPTPAAPSTPTTTALAGAPVVIINSPASNSDFVEGANVAVNSTSTTRNGIVLVELMVDGRVVESSPTPNNQPQVAFSVIQNWQATAGQHTITVRATDARANTGDAVISVNVSGSAQPTAGPTAAIPTAVPPTTAPVTVAPSCTLNSSFVSDVTIPDGTSIAPNSSFVKTWAIKNSGTCAWGSGFNIVFLSGTQMAAPSPSPISAAAPGETINVSLNMISPATPGNYAGLWQLQASNGSLFGTKVDVAINVPGGPPPPTGVPPTPPPAPCNGTPQITSFVANPGTIQQGQVATVSWGQVLNATSVSLNTPQGSSGVATPGQIQVQPGSTTTYTLIAYCYNNAVQAQTTVNVQGVPPPPTPPPSQPDRIQSIQVEKSGDNYKVTVQYFWSGDDPPAVMRAVGVSSGSDPVTNTGQASVEANHVKYVIINLTGKNAATIDVCMQGGSGQDLACSSQAAK